MALLESILREGKKIMAAAGITVTLACTPAVRAQRDYDLYPDRKAEIALYNMRQIAGQICGPPKGLEGKQFPYCWQMSFSKQGAEYAEVDCVLKSSVSGAYCERGEPQTHFFNWEEVRKIVLSNCAVKVCSEGRDCINLNGFKSQEQAQDFAEALNIYVMER